MIDKVNGIQNVFRQFKSPSLDPKMKISFYISSSRLASFSFEAALASVGLLVSLAQAQGKSVDALRGEYLLFDLVNPMQGSKVGLKRL